VNDSGSENGIEIPHRRVKLEDGVLHTAHAETDFTRTMTHELRTPLNVIIGLCQLLERDRESPLSPMQRDAVDRMERNAQTLLQSVNYLIGCLRSGRFE
jgi:signal transduction histidine kinase